MSEHNIVVYSCLHEELEQERPADCFVTTTQQEMRDKPRKKRCFRKGAMLVSECSTLGKT